VLDVEAILVLDDRKMCTRNAPVLAIFLIFSDNGGEKVSESLKNS
jgi:hypothetical protein